MGGTLSPLLVERLNLMLRLYLPMNLKRSRLTDQERAAYEGPWPAGARAVMRVMPREIVTGRRYFVEVEEAFPTLAGKPALILWPDSDPGFGKGELARWQALLPDARTVIVEGAGQFVDEDAPADVAAAISTWWDEVVEPAAGTARVAGIG
jgi:haloalkane dehalogenase